MYMAQSAEVLCTETLSDVDFIAGQEKSLEEKRRYFEIYRFVISKKIVIKIVVHI
mgnify:FL=1